MGDNLNAAPSASPSHSRQASSMSAPSPADPLAELAALRATVGQMHAWMMQQGNQAAQQAHAVHAAQQAAQQAAQGAEQAAQGAHAAVSSRLPKIAPPPRFKGDLASVDAFIRVLNQQGEYYRMDGEAKLQYAVAHLDGPALMWFNGLADKPASWESFIDKLYARFRPVDASMVARQRLGALRQGKYSVSAYANVFQTTLTPISDMSDADQVHYFIQGLSAVLLQRVWEKKPRALAEAIEIAVTVEASSAFAGRAMAAPHSGGRYGASSSDSAPMDIDHVGHDESEEDSVSAPRFHDEPSAPRSDAALLCQGASAGAPSGRAAELLGQTVQRQEQEESCTGTHS